MAFCAHCARTEALVLLVRLSAACRHPQVPLARDIVTLRASAGLVPGDRNSQLLRNSGLHDIAAVLLKPKKDDNSRIKI